MEQEGYGGTSAMAKSVVEPWKDGVVVRTTYVPQHTLVGFDFSHDEGKEEDGDEEQEVASGTADLVTDSSEEE